MGFIKEFKEFALKGNVMDMAVGLVIGSAFQTIIKSLVEDIIMPFTAIFTGNVDYTNWVIEVSIALSVFIAFKCVIRINKKLESMNKEVEGRLERKFGKSKKQEKVEPETKVCPHCLSEVKYKATRCPYCTSELELEKIK